MKDAYLLVRPVPACRRDAFAAGLEACGYRVTDTLPQKAKPGDLVLVWGGNLSGCEAQVIRARQYGATVMVAENGYIGRQPNGQQYYALALEGHNGSGRWHVGAGDRWSRLGIEVKPWRPAGDHIVVCGQRGFGAKRMASPPDWHHRTAEKLRKLTTRTVIVREHGGKPAFHPSTTDDMQRLLEGAHAVVIWSSANGVRALVDGVPVLYSAPHWICAAAAGRGLDAIENPPRPDRMPALHAMAWAMWSVEELATGEPMRHLLDLADRAAA